MASAGHILSSRQRVSERSGECRIANISAHRDDACCKGDSRSDHDGAQ